MKNAKMSTKVKNLLLTKYGLNKKISWKQLHETICEVHNIDPNDRANRGYWSDQISNFHSALYHSTKDCKLALNAGGHWAPTGRWIKTQDQYNNPTTSQLFKMKIDFYELIPSAI